jgi:hypothetical protein
MFLTAEDTEGAEKCLAVWHELGVEEGLCVFRELCGSMHSSHMWCALGVPLAKPRVAL